MFALSVSTSAMISPIATGSPGRLSHLRILPSSMVSESFGMVTSIGMRTLREPRGRRPCNHRDGAAERGCGSRPALYLPGWTEDRPPERARQEHRSAKVPPQEGRRLRLRVLRDDESVVLQVEMSPTLPTESAPSRLSSPAAPPPLG